LLSVLENRERWWIDLNGFGERSSEATQHASRQLELPCKPEPQDSAPPLIPEEQTIISVEQIQETGLSQRSIAPSLFELQDGPNCAPKTTLDASPDVTSGIPTTRLFSERTDDFDGEKLARVEKLPAVPAPAIIVDQTNDEGFGRTPKPPPSITGVEDSILPQVIAFSILSAFITVFFISLVSTRPPGEDSATVQRVTVPQTPPPLPPAETASSQNAPRGSTTNSTATPLNAVPLPSASRESMVKSDAQLPEPPPQNAPSESVPNQTSNPVVAGTNPTRDDSRMADIYINHGWALMARGEVDAAIANLDQAIRFDANKAWAYGRRAYAWKTKTNLDRAITDLDVAIKLDPREHWFFEIRGFVWSLKGEYKRAIVDYNEAIRLAPKSPDAYRLRGLAESETNEPEHAIADFNTSLQYSPNDFNAAYAYAGRGKLLARDKNYLGAIEDFDKAIKINPNNPQFFVDRALIRTESRQYREAISDLDQAIGLKSGNAVAYASRGLVLASMQHYDLAAADLTEAIRIAPNYAGAYHTRGWVFEQLGQIGKALSDYEQAILLDRDDIALYEARARCRSTLRLSGNAPNE
jgi:tetratricopeptide (TPR) repeat protein